MSTPLDGNLLKDHFLKDYDLLMIGFKQSPLFSIQPVLSNGKYVQLSAYDTNEIGRAVSANSSSDLIAK